VRQVVLKLADEKAQKKHRPPPQPLFSPLSRDYSLVVVAAAMMAFVSYGLSPDFFRPSPTWLRPPYREVKFGFGTRTSSLAMRCEPPSFLPFEILPVMRFWVSPSGMERLLGEILIKLLRTGKCLFLVPHDLPLTLLREVRRCTHFLKISWLSALNYRYRAPNFLTC